MQIVGMTKGQLVTYICRQLNHFFPDSSPVIKTDLEPAINDALSRIHTCINGVRCWPQDRFDYLHSSQYCIFIYYLSNSLWQQTANERVCTKLFYLNKALNGFECFYDNLLPEIFFIGHTSGIVLVRNTYRNYLVLYQGSTVGRIRNKTPILEEKVILYPNSSVIGDSRIRSGSVLSQGCSVVNQDTQANSVIFGSGRNLTFTPAGEDIFDDFFRI